MTDECFAEKHKQMPVSEPGRLVWCRGSDCWAQLSKHRASNGKDLCGACRNPVQNRTCDWAPPSPLAPFANAEVNRPPPPPPPPPQASAAAYQNRTCDWAPPSQLAPFANAKVNRPPVSLRIIRYSFTGSDISRSCGREVNGHAKRIRIRRIAESSTIGRTSGSSCSASSEFRKTVWGLLSDSACHREIREFQNSMG